MILVYQFSINVPRNLSFFPLIRIKLCLAAISNVLKTHHNNRGLQGFQRLKPGGAKTLRPSEWPTPFSYNFHIGMRKIYLYIFFNFLKKCGNNQSILTILTKYWVFSDLWTKFHFNQRPASFETW